MDSSSVIQQQLDEMKQQLLKQEKRIRQLTESHIFLERRVERMGIVGKLRPQLGKLFQYPPRPLLIPERYQQLPSTCVDFPVISIVTPSFKQADFLGRTLDSVLNQQYAKLEYIVQDGGSQDGTVEILEQYAPSLKHWESKKDQGQGHAINLGFKHATGDIMAYLNSDDILLPGTLHYVAHFFATHPEVDVVYGHRILIDDQDREVGRWVLPPHDNQVLSWADFIPQETLFWRRNIWEAAGGQIDENFRFALDWDLLLRFREAGARFVRLPRFLGAFRVHLEQKTSAEMSDIGMQEMEILRKRCHGRTITQAEINRHVRKYLCLHVLCQKLYRFGVLSY